MGWSVCLETTFVGRIRPCLKAVISCAVAVLSLVLFVYPAFVVLTVVSDPKLRMEGQSRLAPFWFHSLARRYEVWASDFLKSGFAGKIDTDDVSATEWPMFGSVFLLATADELQRQGLVDAREGELRSAVNRALEVVVSPETATWVKKKWGDGYLDRENVFYRMLLIFGLSSYERITGDTSHRALMSKQRCGLAAELERARFHVLDDYPGECWPNDVLWSVAAIQRAAALEGTNYAALAHALVQALDGPLSVQGLPAFKVDKDTGTVYERPRGCGNSGILSMAAELDPRTTARWFRLYEAYFWKQNAWLAGFTEMPRGSLANFSDVDSGPVLFEYGSVASAFGIGAAKACGRADRAAVLTMEAVACSWPTPFGFLMPRAMGHLAVGGGCLAESALLFSMTRPNRTGSTDPFVGPVPLVVWGVTFAYLGLGAFLIGAEWRAWRRGRRKG